jgi:protein TonB
MSSFALQPPTLPSPGAFRVPAKQAPKTPSQRALSVALVVVVHIAILYGLLTTLGFKTLTPPPHNLIATLLPDTPKEIVPPPPPLPEFAPPPVAIAPIIDIPIELVPSPTAITVPPAPVEPAVVVDQTRARALLATHTTPDYPPVSRRLGEQGTLKLKLLITPQGTVGEATVETSSGFKRLDETAVQWVKSHWRYQPAFQGAKAISYVTQAVVTFKLT